MKWNSILNGVPKENEWVLIYIKDAFDYMYTVGMWNKSEGWLVECPRDFSVIGWTYFQKAPEEWE